MSLTDNDLKALQISFIELTNQGIKMSFSLDEIKKIISPVKYSERRSEIAKILIDRRKFIRDRLNEARKAGVLTGNGCPPPRTGTFEKVEEEKPRSYNLLGRLSGECD